MNFARERRFCGVLPWMRIGGRAGSIPPAIEKGEIAFGLTSFIDRRGAPEEREPSPKDLFVIESADVLENPARTLKALCGALQIPFTDAMLSWPAGRRDTDGVWAPAWYAAVEQSTGFGPATGATAKDLPPHLQVIADQARAHYEVLASHRLR